MVFAVGDLSGQGLAQTVGNVVVIDVNAAGYGWFVDTTPADSTEFSSSTGGALKATASSPAYGRMDLLSVVMHEIGHVLDLEHNGVSGTMMAQTLEAGTRLLSIVGYVDLTLLPRDRRNP